jgi:chitin disaccharide deacetylase
MSETAPRLIVNADDLGRTPGINAGIFEAHRFGLVTSATLMVGWAAAAEAAREWQRCPRLGVGLHVTLTGTTPPTLPASQVPSLVDAAGRLPAKPEGHGTLALAEVLAEVTHQLALFEKLTGRLPTHLDSHHHAHRLPVVLEALIRVARAQGLPVRTGPAPVDARLRAAGVATTDHFEEGFFGAATRPEDLLARLAALPPGTTELMCHPAHVDEELASSSGYVTEREQELATLTDPAVRREVTRREIALITFAEL